MSFRGRYPSKFRRPGNSRGHERSSFKDRGRPFKRKYEDRDPPHIERFPEHMPSRGRGRTMERGRDYYSERGRGRPFKKHFSGPGMRLPRARGRYFRGRQGHPRSGRGRKFDSPREYEHDRSYVRCGSPTGHWSEESKFVQDGVKREFDDEWFEGDEGDEFHYSGEQDIPCESRMRSPLTIHRSFGDDKFYRSPERFSVKRSRLRLRRSQSFERKNFSREREHDFGRCRSPVERSPFLERSNSIEPHRSGSIERRGNFSEYRRTHSIDGRDRFIERERSVSPGERLGSEEIKRSLDFDRRSFHHSLSPPRTYRSRERSYQGSDRERSIIESSRRSIERQIAFEKERLQKMLEHEKKLHEKRSESSIERFLDDCKKSCENKEKSPHDFHSDSLDRRSYFHRSNDRSLSPLDQPRKFRGLEHITIERGRSLERSESSHERRKSIDRRSEFSPERERSPAWRKSFREMDETNSNPGRSRPIDYQRKEHLLMQEYSPEISYDNNKVMLSNSSTRTFQERGIFLEERERPFLGGGEKPFLEEQERAFLEEQERPFLEYRTNSREERSRLQRPNSLDNRERRSLSSSRSRSFKGKSHFLGVGDGPISENRSISKDQKQYDSYKKRDRHFSPVSLDISFDRKEKSRRKREPSPVSQSGSFSKKGFSKTKPSKSSVKLSLVSQPGSFERKEFSHYPETLSDSRGDLSPASDAGSFKDRMFSQESKTGREFSSKLHNKSFVEKEHIDKNFGIERPSSADSMQKFLKELEDDDKSRSSSEKFQFQENQVLKNVCDSQFGGNEKHCTSVKEDDKLKRKANEHMNFKTFGQFSTDKSCKEKEDTQRKSSYYDFKFTLDSMLNTKYNKPSHEEKPREELFNAYENSFLNQACDVYNENLFQGKYEQSSNKPSISSLSKTEVKVPLSQETLTQQLNVNKVSDPSTPNYPPVPVEPQNYQSYDHTFKQISPCVKSDNQYLLNQMPQDQNRLRPDTTHFPNHAIMPMYAFQQQIPSTMPIPAMPYQQNISLPNQGASILQPPKLFIHDTVGNPIFNPCPDKMPDQQNINWQNQHAEFHTNPGKSIKSADFNLFQENPTRNFNQKLRGQAGGIPDHAIGQNVYQNPTPHHFEKFGQNVQPPNKFIKNQNINQFQPWPPHSELKQSSVDIYPDDNTRKNRSIQHNVKEVIVISDDERENRIHGGDNEELVFVSNRIIYPTAKVVEKYKNCPPTYDVLGKIFKGFVIYFGVKENSELQKDPLKVLQESFASSEGFERLDIEEKSEHKPSYSQRKQVCELRWQGILLSRAEEDTREEAQQVAGIALINALAKTCYTIQTKYGYYNNGRYPKFMLKRPEKPGYYKMVKRGEIIESVTKTVKQLRALGLARGADATHINAVISFMDEFFKDRETHCELIFGPTSGMEYTLGELQTMARHALNKGLQCRWFNGNKKVKVLGRFLCVSRYFSPQALHRYLLAENGDTVRYRLFPPQGPKIDLLTTGNFYSPNMIKTILSLAGTNPNTKTNIGHMINSSYADSKSSQDQHWSKQGMNQSCPPDWGYNSGDQDSVNEGNTHPHQSSQNPNPSYPGASQQPESDIPSQIVNPHRTGPDQYFQGSSQEISNPFPQEGFKRNAQFSGGASGKRGKWA